MIYLLYLKSNKISTIYSKTINIYLAKYMQKKKTYFILKKNDSTNYNFFDNKTKRLYIIKLECSIIILKYTLLLTSRFNIDYVFFFFFTYI